MTRISCQTDRPDSCRRAVSLFYCGSSSNGNQFQGLAVCKLRGPNSTVVSLNGGVAVGGGEWGGVSVLCMFVEIDGSMDGDADVSTGGSIATVASCTA